MSAWQSYTCAIVRSEIRSVVTRDRLFAPGEQIDVVLCAHLLSEHSKEDRHAEDGVLIQKVTKIHGALFDESGQRGIAAKRTIGRPLT